MTQQVENLPSCLMAAAEAGSIYYFTGKPCKNGHVAKRRTKGGACIICAKEMSDAHRQRIKELLDSHPLRQQQQG